MTTLTIKINERTKAGKAFMTMSEAFFKGVKGIEIIETPDVKKKKKSDESSYNPEFVKMVLDAAKSKNRTKVTAKNLWQNI